MMPGTDPEQGGWRFRQAQGRRQKFICVHTDIVPAPPVLDELELSTVYSGQPLTAPCVTDQDRDPVRHFFRLAEQSADTAVRGPQRASASGSLGGQS
jgi:hypothetical protein